MTPLQKALFHIGPDVRIVSVEIDEHEHRDTCRCEICHERIQPHDDRLYNGTILAPVAQITFVAEGYEPGGEVLSENGEEWPVTCRRCIREAQSLLATQARERRVA